VGAENITYKFRFASKVAKHLHQPVISMGDWRTCTFSSHFTWTEVWDLQQNNPFLGMFQMKFFLKTFPTCSFRFTVKRSTKFPCINKSFWWFQSVLSNSPWLRRNLKNVQKVQKYFFCIYCVMTWITSMV